MEHYESHGMLDAVDECLVHVDVANMDLHQVVVLCWTHGLYNAMVYVYNKGMGDYVTPLGELMNLLRNALLNRMKVCMYTPPLSLSPSPIPHFLKSLLFCEFLFAIVSLFRMERAVTWLHGCPSRSKVLDTKFCSMFPVV